MNFFCKMFGQFKKKLYLCTLIWFINETISFFHHEEKYTNNHYAIHRHRDYGKG